MASLWATRANVGRLLLTAVVVLSGLAAAFWLGMISVDSGQESIIAGMLFLAGRVLALRFLGES
jgi:hypothetical protein